MTPDEVVDIGIKTNTGIIEPFTDNSIPVCVRCGIRLTEENKSQWSDVVSENKTQGVCKSCLTKEERNADRDKVCIYCNQEIRNKSEYEELK